MMIRDSFPKSLEKIPQEIGFYVYIIRCANNALYTGWTTHIPTRFYKHSIGRGAKYTRAHPPLELFYAEQLANRKDAQKREYEIKSYTRQQKLKLKEGSKDFIHK